MDVRLIFSLDVCLLICMWNQREEDAHNVFEKFPEWSVIAMTAMITLYAHNDYIG